MFNKIQEINIDKPDTWSNKIFITIDVDWAPDFMIFYTYNLLKKLNIKATWFITHKTKLLDLIRKDPSFELGIHPNFNKILFEENIDSAQNIVKELKSIVPDARSVRSHSMTQSSKLSELFLSNDLIYECNTFIPIESKITLSPWINWDGINKIPYFWEDDIFCILHKLKKHSSFTEIQNCAGLKVFNFHPVHLYLNTIDLNLYIDNKEKIHFEEKAFKIINKNFGVKNYLLEIVDAFQ